MPAPTTEDELADTIRTASGPLAIQGGATRGRTPNGTALTTSGLTGITLYEPGALTISARAGTPVAEIEAALAAENQMLAFEPMDHRALLGTTGEPTIGGIVATNTSGPRRVQAGACRDFLLGVRFVDGTGAIVKNGGRVMKNVTGYDLVKLVAGSHGTLGVLSEVSFKVLPRPETEATLVLDGNNIQAQKAMAAALGSPYEVTGAAQEPSSGDGAPVYLRLEGFGASVAYRAGKLRRLLANFGDIRVEEDEASRSIWQGIRYATVFSDHRFVVRLSIKPSNMDDLSFCLANLFFARNPYRMGFDLLSDWGGGLIWVAATDDQLAVCAAQSSDGAGDTVLSGSKVLLDTLRDYAEANGGHATLIKAPPALFDAGPIFQPEPAPLAKLAEGLRRKFDPRGILNPGLMG